MSWPPEDNKLVIELIEADLEFQLGRYFSEVEVVCQTDDASTLGEVMKAERSCAVQWNLKAVHSGEFMGIEPRKTPIEIDGVTVIRDSSKAKSKTGPAIQRFIDWHHVLAQLGSTPGGAMVPITR